jgi:hypothetical protein
LILKNKIHNPSILNLVKQTDIDISQEDYGASANIRNTETLLQIFLAIELFLPVDLWVVKIKEAYNRLFFRLLRSHAVAREQLRRKNALSSLMAFLEKSAHSQLKAGLEGLNKNLQAHRERTARVSEGVAALADLMDAAVQANIREKFEVLRTHSLKQKALEKLAKIHHDDLNEGLNALRAVSKRDSRSMSQYGQTNSEVSSPGREFGVETDGPRLDTHDFSLLRNFVDRHGKVNGSSNLGREKVVQVSGVGDEGSGASKRKDQGGNPSRTDSNMVSKSSTAFQMDTRSDQSPASRKGGKGTSTGEGPSQKPVTPKSEAQRGEKGAAAPNFVRKVDGLTGGTGKQDSIEKPGPVAPQNRYAKMTATTMSPHSRFQQTGEGSKQLTIDTTGDQDSRTSQTVFQKPFPEPFDPQRFKKFLKSLERLLGMHNTKNKALAFEKLKNEVVVLEVLETKDMTKDLDPIGIRLANEHSPHSHPSSENVSIHRRSMPFESSVRNRPIEVSDVVFIRKSNFFPVEAQVNRYSQIVKPQSQLLDQMAEVRKEEGSQRSFVLQQGLTGHNRHRLLTSSMVLEPTNFLDSKKRSFVVIKEEDPAATQTSAVGQGLRARYK